MVASREADMPTAPGALLGTPSSGCRAGGTGWVAVTTANNRFSNADYLDTNRGDDESCRVLSRTRAIETGGRIGPSSWRAQQVGNTVRPPGEFQAAGPWAASMSGGQSTSK